MSDSKPPRLRAKRFGEALPELVSNVMRDKRRRAAPNSEALRRGSTHSRPTLKTAILLFSALTVATTWPQAVQPAGIPPHPDSWLNMWRVAWVAHQLPRDPIHLFDANIHHPEKGTLAYSDATLLQGLIACPAIWLGMPTPYVYTLLVMMSFVFAGVAAWALVQRLTGSSQAGIAAGVIFAFTPYRFDHYMHLELLWTGWMPLTLLALHQAMDRGTIKAGIATGLLFGAQVLSCIYYSVFFGTVLVAFCGVLAMGRHASGLRRAAISLGCGAVVGGVLALAYLAPYRQARAVVGERSVEEAMLYSAGPRHYLAATPENLLYGGLANEVGRHEKRLFPGLVAVILAAVALWPPVSRLRAAYLVALLLAIDLSFGPTGLTYNWLREYVLPYRGLRVPARAGSVALLMIAVLAGFGLARLERIGRLNRLVVVGVLAAITLEYVTTSRTLMAAPTRPEPVYAWLAAQSDGGAVIELPMPDEDGPPMYEPEFMYRSTFHWHPLVNGYSGNVPGSYMETRRALRTFPSDTAIERLRSAGVRYIVVHERLFGSARFRAVTLGLEARPDLTRHGPFGRAGDTALVYALDVRAAHD